MLTRSIARFSVVSGPGAVCNAEYEYRDAEYEYEYEYEFTRLSNSLDSIPAFLHAGVYLGNINIEWNRNTSFHKYQFPRETSLFSGA